MTDTTFVPQTTPILSTWLNDINNHVYRDSPVAPAVTVHSAGEIRFLQSGTGAVARTAQDKMRETVSVKDFGAVADYIVSGTINSTPTDNLTAFTRAFAVSRHVKVPVGAGGGYYISAPISIPRNGILEGDDNNSIDLIGNTDCLLQPLGTDAITVNNIRFNSVNKGVALNTGTPVGADYSSDNEFNSCFFGNSLSYAVNGKTQLLIMTDCGFACPVRITSGNYPTLVRPVFVFNDLPTTVSTIQGVTLGAAGSGYFNVAAFRHDEGHSAYLDSPWFEHIPACACLFGTSCLGWTITNPHLERVCNSPVSTSLDGSGWMIYSGDASGYLTSAHVSGGGVIGNLGNYSNGIPFTPDALGIFGGLGVKKLTVDSLGSTFFEIATAPAGGWKMFQYLPKWSSGCGQGIYNSAPYAITVHHSDKTGYFKAKLGASQTFTSGVFDKAACASVIIDVEGWYTAGSARYTPVSAFPCLVEFDAKTWIAAMAAGKKVFIALYKNGAIYEYFCRMANGTGGSSDIMANGVVTATANGTTDYFELFVYNEDTVNRTAFADANAVVFSGRIIGYQAT